MPYICQSCNFTSASKIISGANEITWNTSSSLWGFTSVPTSDRQSQGMVWREFAAFQHR